MTNRWKEDAVAQMFKDEQEIVQLHTTIAKLETAHGQNMKEIDKLRADLAAERERARKIETMLAGAGNGLVEDADQIKRLTAELAAAKSRIEAAYKEGWWDSSDRPLHTPEQAEKDWLDSDAAMNRGGDE